MRTRRLGRLTIAASLGQAAWATRRQWQALPGERRSRLQALLRQSAGGPANLSATDRQELRGLIGELNLGVVLRNSAIRATRGGRRW
ncbi:MAG: hypothetical protein ACXVFQ_15240 [Solirubrobacteraceae bacterium]